MHDVQMIIKSVGEHGPIAVAFQYIVKKIGNEPSKEDEEEMSRLDERIKSLSVESAELLKILQLKFQQEFHNERKRAKGKGSFFVPLFFPLFQIFPRFQESIKKDKERTTTEWFFPFPLK